MNVSFFFLFLLLSLFLMRFHRNHPIRLGVKKKLENESYFVLLAFDMRIKLISFSQIVNLFKKKS